MEEVQIWFERAGDGGKRTRRRWDGGDGTPLDDLLRVHRDALQVIFDRCFARSPGGVGYDDTKDWVFKFMLALLETGHACDVWFESGPQGALGVVVSVLDAESAEEKQMLNRWASHLRSEADYHEHALTWARRRLGAYERTVAGLLQKRGTP